MNSKPLSIILLAASVAGIAWASTAVGDGSMLPAIVAAVSMLAGIIDVVLFAASSGSAVAGVLAAVISIALAASAAGVTTLAMVGAEAGEAAPAETTVETPGETVEVTPSVPASEPAKPQQETTPEPSAPEPVTGAGTALGTVPGTAAEAGPEALITVPEPPVVYVREQTLVPDKEAEPVEEAAAEEVPVEEALIEEAAVEEEFLEEGEAIEAEEAVEEVAEEAVPAVPAVPAAPGLSIRSKTLAGVPEEPQITAVEAVEVEEAAEEEAYEPIVITESVLGYTLTVTIYPGKVILEYPSIVTEEDAAGFFAYEVDKYGEAYLAGIYYTSEKGASTLTVPETVSEETIVSAVPVLVDDIIEYVSLLLAPAVPEEPLITAVEAAEAEEAYEPIVITESVLGYTLTVTIYPGKVVLEYPSIVTEEDAAGFFAYEVDKYGSYINGIYYTSEKGASTLRVPETVSEETIVSAVPVLVDDIIEYVSLLLAPAVPEEPLITAVEAAEVEEAYEPIVITESVLGYTLTVTVYPGKVVLEYPSIVTEEDAAGFFAYEVDKYGSYIAGIYYTSEKGASTLRVPETVSEETIVSAVPVLVDDIIEYVSLLLAPAVPEEPQVTAVEVEEAYEPIVITESVLGYTLTVTVYPEKVVLGYPSIVTEADAAGFFAYEVDKYGSYIAGIYYTSEKGASTLRVPETVSDEAIVSAVPVLVDDIIEYVSVLLAPAEEAAVSVPVVEAEVPDAPEIDVRSIMLIEEMVPDAPEVDVRSIMLIEEELPETPDVDVRSIELLEAEVPDAPEIYYTLYLED